MNFQPVFFEELTIATPTTLETCGEDYLQVFESGKIPTFVFNNNLAEYSHDVILTDADGNIIQNLGSFTMELGFNNNVYSTFFSGVNANIPQGVFRFMIKGSFNLGAFIISDTYLFLDDVSCLVNIKFSNDCFYKFPYHRVPNFEYSFYLNKNSKFSSNEYTYTETIEELSNGNEVVIDKGISKNEVLNIVKISTRTYESIIEGATLDNFNVYGVGTDSDITIKHKQFDALDLDDCSCIFNTRLLINRYDLENSTCCRVGLEDCIDFELIDVNSVDNEIHILNSVLGSHIGCYGSIEFGGSQINQVLCSDSIGNWIGYTPLHFLDTSTGYYYELNNLGYYERVNYIVSTSNLTATTVDLTINSMYNQLIGVDISIDLSPLTPVQDINSINIGSYTHTYQIQLPTPVALGGHYIGVQLYFKNIGCTEIIEFDFVVLYF